MKTNIQRVANRAKILAFKERFKSFPVLVITTWVSGFELMQDGNDNADPRRDYKHARTMNLNQIICELFIYDKYSAESDPDEFDTIDRVKEVLGDMYNEDGRCIVETPKEKEHRESEAERKELEACARMLAQRHKVDVNSVEFIKACFKEIEGFKSYREGMREDGLCIGFGVTSEQWFDEYNASKEDDSQVYRLIEWVKNNLPLLWAKYEANKDKDDDE